MMLMDFWERNRGCCDAVLLDLDGTLLLGSRPLPGAAEWTRRLREAGVPFLFLTNNCSDTADGIAERLSRAGIPARSAEIAAAAAPLGRELERRGWLGLKFFLIGNPEFPERHNIRFETDPARIDECEGVLFLGGAHDWREDFHAVFNTLLRRPSLPVVIPNPDLFNPLPDGRISFCPLGQFELVLRLLEKRGIRVEPLSMGKPCPAIYDHALSLLPGISRERVLAVGDSLSSDIEGANRSGMVSALLLTGLASRAEAEAASGMCRPALVFDGIAAESGLTPE